MAAPSAPETKYRKDYTPTPYLIDTVNLDFILNEDVTLVVSKLQLKPNYSGDEPAPIFLDGKSHPKKHSPFCPAERTCLT